MTIQEAIDVCSMVAIRHRGRARPKEIHERARHAVILRMNRTRLPKGWGAHIQQAVDEILIHGST